MGSASLYRCALEIWMAGAKTATGASKKSPGEDAMVVFAGTLVICRIVYRQPSPTDKDRRQWKGYRPRALSSPEASGEVMPVKSVNISIWSLVLPRLRIFSRNALPTAGPRAPCLAK